MNRGRGRGIFFSLFCVFRGARLHNATLHRSEKVSLCWRLFLLVPHVSGEAECVFSQGRLSVYSPTAVTSDLSSQNIGSEQGAEPDGENIVGLAPTQDLVMV